MKPSTLIRNQNLTGGSGSRAAGMLLTVCLFILCSYRIRVDPNTEEHCWETLSACFQPTHFINWTTSLLCFHYFNLAESHYFNLAERKPYICPVMLNVRSIYFLFVKQLFQFVTSNAYVKYTIIINK